MYRYRLNIEPDDNGTRLVTSPDLPIVTFGSDRDKAIEQADDALKAILGSMMDVREDVPEPNFQERPEDILIKLSLQTELQVQLYREMRKAGLTRTDLQRRLGWNNELVDRLFDLDHEVGMEQVEQAFAALGRTLSIQICEAA